MEQDKFYLLVAKMRDMQTQNKHRKLSLDELMKQWRIEFLVDDALFRNSGQNLENPKIQADYSMFYNTYCSN